MNLSEMAQFGPYVWGAYALFAVALLIEVVGLRVARRHIDAQLRQAQALADLMQREHDSSRVKGEVS